MSFSSGDLGIIRGCVGKEPYSCSVMFVGHPPLPRRDGRMSKEQRMEMEKGCELGPEPLFSSWTTRDEEDGDELELEEEEAGFRDGQHVAWSADKMRRLMTQFTGQHMGVEVNISSWRHIWIAISRKFLIGDSQFVAFENKASKSATSETDVRGPES